MSLITRNAKEYRSMTAQLMSQNLPIVSCSFGIFCVLRHPNHFLLAGANNRNVIITYRFLAAAVLANGVFFYIDCMTVYFNCKYCPLIYARVTRVPPRNFAFWAKSLRGQIHQHYMVAWRYEISLLVLKKVFHPFAALFKYFTGKEISYLRAAR